jgi:hypothetical protein
MRYESTARCFLVLSLLVFLLSNSFVPVALAQLKAGEEGSTDQLIIQLGSRKFPEREQAARALLKLGTKALPKLKVAAKLDKDPERKRRAVDLIEIIENSLQALLERYCELGLPLPPPGARLVSINNGVSEIGPEGKTTNWKSLGFVLRPSMKQQPPLLLIGTEEYSPSIDEGQQDVKRKLTDFQPDSGIPDHIDGRWGFLSGAQFEICTGIATALQCKAEGMDGLARELWNRFGSKGTRDEHCKFYHPPNLPPRQALAHVAWTHYGNELAKPGSDRTALLTKMKSLMKAEPAIDSKEKQEVIRSLELALVPGKSPPGSPGFMIDQLVEMNNPWTNPGDRNSDPRYLRLCETGFAAVPALIERMDDPRLTRVIGGGFHHAPLRLCSVGEFATAALYGVTGFDVIRRWRNPHTDPVGSKADALDWFLEAQAVGEEAYYVKHIFPENPADERFNHCMLHLIAIKFPKQLPGIYRTILEKRTTLPSWSVAYEVLESSLPISEKATLFNDGAKHAKESHREAGEWALKELEKKISLLKEKSSK